MNTVFLSELCIKIGFSEEDTEEIMRFLENERTSVCSALNRCSILPVVSVIAGLSARGKGMRHSGMLRLCFCVAMCEKVHEQYVEKGIPDEIFYDTMADIYVWAEHFRKEYGFLGINEIMWICNHLNCSLFKIGRLQFQLYRLRFPLYIDRSVGRKAPVKLGKRCINVHIPEGEPLETQACLASFEAAEEFFAKYFPKFDYKCFACDSWLLSPALAQMLPPESNIVKFASLWQILGSGSNSSQAIERIFGKGIGTAFASFPENTSLQRAAKAMLMNGKSIGMGFGLRLPRSDEKKK